MQNPSTVNRSPLNGSPSKQLYSFSKSRRFGSSDYVSPAPFYDNKVTAINKRATSFGYGHKMTLENKTGFPAPTHYPRGSSFEQNMNKKKGYAFQHDRKKGLIN